MLEFHEEVGAHRIPAFDGLRAVAFAFVMGFHFGLTPFFAGRLSLDSFFVISGFLITLLMVREREATGDVSLRNFYVRRALRIFPAYYVFLMVTFATLWLAGTPPSRPLIVLSLTYLLDYAQAFGHVRQTLVSHGWSLSVEEQFYALWPPVLFLLTLWRLPTRRIVVALIAAVLVWRVVLSRSGQEWYLYYAFEARFDAILVGCGLALCYRDRWLNRLARVVSAHRVLPLVTLAALVLIALSPAGDLVYGETLFAPLLAILLIQTIMLHRTASWGWLNWSWVRYVGRISYPLYLYHQLAGHLAFKTTGVRYSVQMALALLLTFAFAMTSYHVIEVPFLRLKKAFESRPVAAGVPAARRRQELQATG